jgi:hypothetical protein
MGEAKAKGRRHAQKREEQPFCVYCGGDSPTETIDHMPPITIFAGRRRPRGLEFGACTGCNAGSKGAEQILGMLSRLYPDVQPDREDEFRDILQGVKNNHPALFEEMQATETQQAEGKLSRLPGDVLNVSGPIVNSAVKTVGAKLGLAMHFEKTRRLVPKSGAVAVRWFSNVDALTAHPALSAQVFRLLGPPETLAQGTFQVGDQFTVASSVAAGSRLSAHFATFRFSLSILTAVAEDAAQLAFIPEPSLYRPGWLKA